MSESKTPSNTPRTDAFIAGRDPIRLPQRVGEDMDATIAIGHSIRRLMIDYADFARQLERELAASEARVKELNERLENNHYYDSDGNRIECDPGDIPDGIDCRDEIGARYARRRAGGEAVTPTDKQRRAEMPAQKVVEALVRIGKCKDRIDNPDLCITRELKKAYAFGARRGLERAREICKAKARTRTTESFDAIICNAEDYACADAIEREIGK